ncbi:RAN binding protein 3 like [Phyllostomus discolor]|uniref:Ran-binding protein 3-like n=1 Tax=Phyllostomus discolor TaxID=89673 RepID=A0A6J2MIA6_9CHIR|nr:ran-binding protein 3-like [Phyllostomus discolor]KAF6126823.1 RAN binding protein 3 like [Phyllostomus discolor]
MSATQREGSSHLLHGWHTCRLKLPGDQRQHEKSVIAQPIFVFEKKEQSSKRPAEEALYEAAGHECNGFSRKRIRSSSFSLHTADSHSQGVKKNKVFMTPTLVQRNVDMNSAEQGPVKHPERVLRPAILQPPRTQRCDKVKHSASEHCKTTEKTKHKISERNSCLLSKNLPRARVSVQLSANQSVWGAPSVGCQPNEDKSSFKSCSSDFVFGENMVERVLGTQKLTQPQLENDSYAKEKLFRSTLKFPVNSPNSRTDSIKNRSLIESAAALSSESSPTCLLKKIDVITGEEAEHNVLKINCKLFVFNKATESWTERGRGALRLNDTAGSHCGVSQSRLVMRNQGSLRLILNSKLWAQMEIQRANHLNLRITATDLEDYSIKVFLIQANAKDTGSLYAAIHHRLVALRSSDKQEDAAPAEGPADMALQQLNGDSCDEDEDEFFQAAANRSDPSRWTHRQSVACS